MRYDAVLHYANEGHRSYSRYHLPSDPPAFPTANDESVCVRGNIFRDDSDSGSDESDMFIWHHARRRKRQRRDRDEDGVSDEEPEEESPEEEEQSSN